MAKGLRECAAQAGVPSDWAERLADAGELSHLYRRMPDGRRSGYQTTRTITYLQERYARECGAAAHPPPEQVKVEGLTPADRQADPARVWQKALDIQTGKREVQRRRYSQTITIPVDGDGREPCRLLAVNAGNHDNRSVDIAGIDWLAEVLESAPCLYDQNEITFTLRHGDHETLWKLRHKWRYRSILNPFHSFMRDLERTDDFDIAIGGHVHSGTHYARFDHHSREECGPTDRYAILLGTYEYGSKYGLRQGYSRHTGRGCAALVIHPDGGQTIMDSIPLAAAYLEFARGRFGAGERPVAIALMSDIHVGNEYCDYQQVRDDVAAIVSTPGMYCMILGDCADNWIGKLEGIQRAQPMSHGEEMALVRSVLGALMGREEAIRAFI